MQHKLMQTKMWKYRKGLSQESMNPVFSFFSPKDWKNQKTIFTTWSFSFFANFWNDLQNASGVQGFCNWNYFFDKEGTQYSEALCLQVILDSFLFFALMK